MLIESLSQAQILIVDDDPDYVNLLKTILDYAGFKRLHSLTDPRGVIASFLELEPDLVILDLNMPHYSGFDLLRLMRPLISETEYLPVLVVTGEDSFESRRQALVEGASDLLTKPYRAEEVVVRVSNMLRLRRTNLYLNQEVRRRTQELEANQLQLKEAQLETTLRLARAGEHHDDDTGKHTQRVGLLCSLLAQSQSWGSDQVHLIHYAAPLHDVGKIGIPDAILLKSGRLTDTERAIMRKHTLIGADLLSGGRSELIRMAERIARTHHERWDGAGYPNGLSGEAIDIEGRAVAVVDVFDALTHKRPYKEAWPIEKALEEIDSQRGIQFDPRMVESFLQLPGDVLEQVSRED